MVSSSGRRAKLLVAYYSYTGNTKLIAQALAERLRDSFEVEVVEIVPTRACCYLLWLAYSFVPGSEVDVGNPEMQLSPYDAVLLGFPKWTFSCPPLNRFIRRLGGLSKPRFYLFMTCGGFDEQRYLDSLTHKLTKMGCNIAGSLTIQRRQIQTETYGDSVESFAKRIHEKHVAGR
jgi:hypothetical protein